MIDTIRWRRLDIPGRETARLESRNDGWKLSGVAEFEHEGRTCRLEYSILCDVAWKTRTARVAGSIGDGQVDLAVSIDRRGRWCLNGEDYEAVEGLLDIDLGFSPSTNLLPIRRLGLRVGERADVTAAWLPFPALAFEPLEQTYHREGEGTYVYSSRGSFVRTLEVNPRGFVTHYPGFWRAAPCRAPGET